MIQYDSHIHTAFSTDSDTPMEDMIRQGIINNLSGITFTDHMDYGFPDTYEWNCPDGYSPFTFNLEQYIHYIQQFKDVYRDQIQIFCGVEIGLKEDVYEENVSLSQHPSLDYRIGSIHLVDNMDPYYPEYWECNDEKRSLEKYFETTLINIEKLGDIQIDTFGHLDYIVRYAPSGYKLYSYRAFSDLIDEILRQLIHREISLEVNTSGYKNGGTMPNPSEDILRRYKDLGGERISFGSDAHTPDRLSKHFTDAEKLVRELGYRRYVTFVEGNEVWHEF